MRFVKSFQSALYFLIPLFLWDLQFGFTRQSLHEIRTEEISESIRNVFWLSEGTLYDGISSNVGYYAMLLGVYKIFGFNVFFAKYMRLVLHLISLFCLAIFLKRTLGIARALPALAVIGLSPTLLYFNAIQTSFGMDLQFAPLCLLLLSLNSFTGLRSYFLSGMLGMLATITCMAYPSFLSYLPSLGLLAGMAVYRTVGKKGLFFHGLIVIGCSLLPLMIALLYLDNPALLINDPVTGSGIFRGGGQISLDFFKWGYNFLTVIEDIFYHGTSYYFEIAVAEFSTLPIQIITLAFTGYGIVIFFLDRFLRPYLLASFILIGINIVLPNLTDTGFPGLRRATGLVAGFYSLFCVLLLRWKWEDSRWYSRVVLLSAAGVFLFHHSMAYRENFRAIGTPSKFTSQDWFAIRNDPVSSLQIWLEYQESGNVLQCSGPDEKPVECFYSRIYGALAGYRRWNKMEEIPVRAIDWKTGKVIQLDTSLWESYYFPH